MVILESKWQPCCDIRKQIPFSNKSPAIKDKPEDLTRYNIKINLKVVALDEKRDSLEIRFCDKYSLILAGSKMPSGVYYYKTNDSMEKYVSKVNYKNIITGKKMHLFGQKI